MVAIEEEIDAEIDKYVNMRAEIESVIDTVDDITLRALLRYRYLNGLTWEKIAAEMNYCYMQVCRLHGLALEKIML